MSPKSTPLWQVISREKCRQRLSKIPKKWLISTESLKAISSTSAISFIKAGTTILTESDRRLTDPEKNDATDLLEKIAMAEVKSVDVTKAFCKRAAIAHQLTNCLTEIMFEEAIARANWLDEQLRVTGKVVGPLHGLPITFKDSFDIEGYDSCIGISSLCFDPAKRNSLLYDIFTANGAIVIAKTTVPQTMLNSDTDSIVFGRTVNAHKPGFGAAGSTGGEGSLIALGGSCFGIGTDGAGSVRMPAAVNGIIGYKPSGYRLPLDGRPIMGHGVMGSTTLGPVSVTGFLGRSVRDITLFSKLVADAEPWARNPFIYPHPWQGVDSPSVEKLKIGIWSSNGYLNLHPPVRRGLEIAQERLRDAGAEIIPFNGPDISDVWELQKEWTEVQDLSYLRGLLSTEPHTNIVKETAIITKDRKPPTLDLYYLHSLNSRIRRLVSKMHKAWSCENGRHLDALLWVPAPHTAVPFDKYTYLGFTGLFNLIDWPALTLPLEESVDKAIDKSVKLEPLNEVDAKIQGLYDANTFDGLPLSVQLIGRRFEDEKLLAVSELVHKVIKDRIY